MLDIAEPFLGNGDDLCRIVRPVQFQITVLGAANIVPDRTTAAVSIAVINSIGNLGGFAGPSLIGMVKGNSHSASTGLLFLSALLGQVS